MKKVWKKFYRAARIWTKAGTISAENAEGLYLVNLDLGRAVWSYGEGRKVMLVFAWKDGGLINLGTLSGIHTIRRDG